MKIFYEDYKKVLAFNMDSGNTIVSKKTHEIPLKDVFAVDDVSINDIFLVDEEHFHFYYVDVALKLDHKLTLTDLYALVRQNRNNIRTKYANDYLLYVQVMDIFVEDKKSDYVLQQSGNIRFTLCYTYCESQTFDIFVRQWWVDACMKSGLRIYPKSYFSMQWILEQLRLPYYDFLYVSDFGASYISTKNGKYEDIQKIPVGVDFLKNLFRQENHTALYYESFDAERLSDIQQDVIKNHMGFYCQQLVDVVREYRQHNWLILVSHLHKNSFFLRWFMERAQQQLNIFVLPFRLAEKLKKSYPMRLIDYIDVLMFHQHLQSHNKNTIIFWQNELR